MESKQQKQQIPSSPSPNPPPSSLFRDISNFKTPKPQRTNPSFSFESPCPQFFTALKQTPKSSYSSSTVRRRPRVSLAAQRLKAVELEQSKSSRKNQSSKEKSLKSLAKSLTVWLNFLFENPRSCGVEVSRFTGEDWSDGSAVVFSGGKRDSVSHDGVGIEREWRGPKRRKDMLWVHKGDVENKFSSSTYLRLQVSLGDVCSLDDMKERMAVYLSLGSCKEIFDVMTHVTKNIDEGRLKMKAHCPIVTDVGMKENALKILMCYNPVWLRIGLYIIFGGESLLPKPNTDKNSEQEISFLKVVAEKLFFSHAGLAKAYIYNKLVDGLYRPGYYEKLGSVILKRFLLLALMLDRAKSQSSLPISYGIDGLDGGSPLLFTSRSSIKSSSEVISDFLSPDVMHGVGNLLAHLTIIGYKVSYQQNPLVKYVFKVTDLFNDLQDGVLLCRVIQLLQHDPSILKKVVAPSDDRKKNLVNCEISLQYLKQTRVSLYDEDGTEIIAEDVVNGDKELIISLLWNMFVHLQLPLLINNKLVSEEITKIRGPGTEILPNISNHLEMILKWIQAICENYDLRVENFASLVDGKAMWCLLDYYFRKEHAKSKEDLNETNEEVSIMSASDYVDAVHNFVLSQKLTTLLGNFPEVLQVSDILEYKGACSDRGVIILLVFLSSQLIVKRNLQQINFHKLFGHNQNSERKCNRKDRLAGNNEGTSNIEEICENDNRGNARNFKAIMSWWQEMAQHNSKYSVKPVYPELQSFPSKQSSDTNNQRENAVKIIQSHFRRMVEYRSYTHTRNTILFLQIVIRAWLTIKNTPMITNFNTIKIQEPLDDGTKASKRFLRYLVDRHTFTKLTRCAVIIQKCIRGCAARSVYVHRIEERALIACQKVKTDSLRVKAALRIQVAWRKHVNNCIHNHRQSAATIIQKHHRGRLLRKSFLNQKQAATKILSRYLGRLWRKSFLNQKQAVVIIQSHYREWRLRNSFLNQKQAATRVQSCYRGRLLRISFLNLKQSATIIQSLYRGWLSRSIFLNQKQAATIIQSYYRECRLRKSFLNQKQAATRIQSHIRGCLSKKSFLETKQAVEIKSAITIQSHTRGWIARQVTYRHRYLIVLIQSFCRGWLTRRAFLSQKEAAREIQNTFRSLKCSNAFNRYRHAAIEIQRFVRGWINRKKLLGCQGTLLAKTRTESAAIIQSHVRGWIARRKTAQRRHRIALIQSYWKGWIERKHSRGKVTEIRMRMQKSAVNVDDGMRIINRLIVALSELKNTKSVSGILHTCATLDMATKHSQKCCEKLVEAGAIDTLFVLIGSISRSVPEQEVLRHTLSIFRNLTRHAHLMEALTDTRGLGQTILWEFIRNKDDAYFIAADVLRNMCSSKKGVERLRVLHALVKRLHNLVEDLRRKSGNEKRNPRSLVVKEQTDRRLKEAVEILKLITNG